MTVISDLEKLNLRGGTEHPWDSDVVQIIDKNSDHPWDIDQIDPWDEGL